MSNNPFSTPGTPASSGTRCWRSLKVLAVVITIAIAMYMIGLIGISCGVTYTEMVSTTFNDSNADFSDTDILVSLLTLVAIVVFVAGLLVAMVATCMFMYRANVNVRVTGATGLDNSPGWCGGYWFIPIANLFMPYQCMNEIERASQAPQGTKWKSIAANPLLSWWWGFYIIGGIFTRVTDRLATSEVIKEPATITICQWIGTLLMLGAAVAFVMVVRRVSGLQSSPNQKIPETTARYGEHLYSQPHGAD